MLSSHERVRMDEILPWGGGVRENDLPMRGSGRMLFSHEGIWVRGSGWMISSQEGVRINDRHS